MIEGEFMNDILNFVNEKNKDIVGFERKIS